MSGAFTSEQEAPRHDVRLHRARWALIGANLIVWSLVVAGFVLEPHRDAPKKKASEAEGQAGDSASSEQSSDASCQFEHQAGENKPFGYSPVFRRHDPFLPAGTAVPSMTEAGGGSNAASGGGAA